MHTCACVAIAFGSVAQIDWLYLGNGPWSRCKWPNGKRSFCSHHKYIWWVCRCELWLHAASKCKNDLVCRWPQSKTHTTQPKQRRGKRAESVCIVLYILYYICNACVAHAGRLNCPAAVGSAKVEDLSAWWATANEMRAKWVHRRGRSLPNTKRGSTHTIHTIRVHILFRISFWRIAHSHFMGFQLFADIRMRCVFRAPLAEPNEKRAEILKWKLCKMKGRSEAVCLLMLWLLLLLLLARPGLICHALGQRP